MGRALDSEPRELDSIRALSPSEEAALGGRLWKERLWTWTDWIQAPVFSLNSSCDPGKSISPFFFFFFLTAYFDLFICFLSFIYVFIFLLYNTVLVLPYINMNAPRLYMRSQT